MWIASFKMDIIQIVLLFFLILQIIKKTIVQEGGGYTQLTVNKTLYPHLREDDYNMTALQL
jgi:hypothetical protein